MQYNDKDESEPDTPWKQKDETSRTEHEYKIIKYILEKLTTHQKI